jgi:CelD/BcsL family acetyltransferase involved in cellulose biosynthesis
VAGLHVDVTPIDETGFMTHESAWRELERSARDRASPYLSFDWLSSWLEIYAPDRVAVIRVTSDHGVAALGLVDQGRGGHWRFAGHQVTPHRALLCVDDDASAWVAGLVGRQPQAVEDP